MPSRNKKWVPKVVYQVRVSVLIAKHIYTEDSLIVNGADMRVFRAEGAECSKKEAYLTMNAIKKILGGRKI